MNRRDSRTHRIVVVLVALTGVFGMAAASAAARVPNDPRYIRQYALDNTGQSIGGVVGTPDADIDAREAWDVTTGSAGVIVADVDDGYDPAQLDLAPNIVPGWDFGNNDSDPTETASNHGSQTASVLGARGDNGIGMAGVNWTVSIMPLKVRTDGPGERFDMIAPTAIADAFRYAAAHGARVVNASLGLRSTTTSTERAAILTAIKAAPETLFVVSAGNSGRDNDASPRFPCSYDAVNVLCIAASDQDDTLWASSNYGANSVDLAAPGVRINTVTGTNVYGYVNGTSYAAPMVSGVAALYLARYPTATIADVRRAILGGVDVKPALAGKTVTGGRLNAANTLAIAPSTSLAKDGFTRTVAGGWGTAPTGGAWKVLSGATSSFSTDGAQALIATPTGGAERRIVLTNAQTARDVDARADVTFQDPTGTSGAVFGSLVLRRQATDGSYLRVGLYAQGTSLLIRGQASSGATLWTNVNTGLGFSPGTAYGLRVELEGASPTTIRARAWKLGTPEPETWNVVATTSSGPQVAGTVGLRGVDTTATPTVIRFDDFEANRLAVGAP